MRETVKDLILGTMKSAKSAQLIMKGFLLDEQGKKVLTFKPERDTRDGAYVVSRALPVRRKAIIVPKDNNGSKILAITDRERPDVILVDELQFFTDKQIEAFAEVSLRFNVSIYAYGLMMSYNGRIFEPVKRALECSFRLQMIDSPCDDCNNDATHHLLYVDGEVVIDGESIHVGDKEYKSVCYSCYQKAIKSKK